MACIESRNIVISTRSDNKALQGIGFDMRENGNPVPGDVINCNKPNNAKKNTDYHRVSFELQNGAGIDLRFLKDRENVMWVQPGTQCPENPATDRDFEVEYVSDDCLVVRNYNRRATPHKFSLNFLGKEPGQNNTTLIRYDPGWGNGNGGQP